MCCSLAGAVAIPSTDEKIVYLFGGVSSDYEMNTQCLKVIIYNVNDGTSILHIDTYNASPFNHCLNPPLGFLYLAEGSIEMFVFY